MLFPDGHAHPPVPDINAPLMPIDDLAPLLGLTVPVAEPLASQIDFAAKAVTRMLRNYTGRRLTFGTYVEDFAHPSVLVRAFEGGRVGTKINLTEWPVASVASITVGVLPIDMTGVVLNHSLGRLWLPWQWQASSPDSVSVTYDGGYDPFPPDLLGVYLDLVRRQLAAMGADLAAGGSTIPVATAAVKAVTVGALKIDYAVASQPAAAGAAGGVSPLTADALAAFGPVLDEYRSVRKYAATIF